MRHLLNPCKAFVCFVLLLFTSIVPVRAEDKRDRFCVVPVLDGEPTDADVGATWRMTNSQHRIPGLPSLVFTPTNRQGEWIVDKDRRFSKYVAPFPKSYLDKNNWVREPWSGRVVATNSRNVNVLEQGKQEFESLQLSEELKVNNFSRPYLLPDTEETLVTSAESVYVVGQSALVPWVWNSVLKERGIDRPSFYFSKELGATVILNPVGRYSSKLTDVFVLSGDGKLDSLGRLETPNYGVDLVDLKGESSTLLKTAFVIARIDSIVGSNGLKKYSIHILHKQIGNGAGTHFAESKLHKTILQLKALEGQNTRHSWYRLFFDYFFEESGEQIKRPEYRQWYRINRNGLSAIPGGRLPALDRYYNASWLFHEFPELGISLIEAADGFHWFDGKSINPVPDSSPEIIGKYKLFAGSKSIGRLIFRSERGLFEFLKSGPKPLLIAGLAGPEFHIVDVADWSEANVVLVQTKSGLFALDGDLNVAQLSDNSVAGSRFFSFVGTNPQSGDMILNGEKSLFVLVDTVRNGKDICRR
ncbi:MAG: hypothetical protein Q8L53_07375 [Aestuariivirga sp.]|nr:hypothetical protein [Aestuariivirga sp.]